jgi:hypothetical protein
MLEAGLLAGPADPGVCLGSQLRQWDDSPLLTVSLARCVFLPHDWEF